ncbi:protein phosphatase 1 regulatory subunit 42-like isoform X2 [Uloborus diversus]|nr:protein phosphatase 1 regulatory subunit 42-like isoform X2 [Uloborus diversus]
MKISNELILRCSSRHLLDPRKGEGDEAILSRITHLYLQEQHIRNIENLENCENLLALYLYDNRIERIENLEGLSRLNCLYLQGNRIKTLDNLNTLEQLTVLNISRNAITKLENLKGLANLRELYIEYQKIPDDAPALEVDPESIEAIAGSLQVLSVSGNRLKTLQAFRPLRCLQHLQAEENHILDLTELVETAGNWAEIRHLRLSSNPVCRQRKYRDSLVVACLELEDLDSRPITSSYRNFLLNWQQCRALQELKKESYTLLKPFLQEQIHNRQLTPASSRQSSVSSSQSETATAGTRTRSRSIQRKSSQGKSLSRARSLQEVRNKIVKKFTKGNKAKE